jgi:hypothetical protein
MLGHPVALGEVALAEITTGLPPTPGGGGGGSWLVLARRRCRR